VVSGPAAIITVPVAGFVGGIVGGIIGYWGGSNLGQKAWDSFRR